MATPAANDKIGIAASMGLQNLQVKKLYALIVNEF
jgi:hypothetical protein